MAIIKQKVLGGKTLYFFFPHNTFEAEVHGKTNVYVKAMRYNVREGNVELHERVHSWQKQGLVQILRGN